MKPQLFLNNIDFNHVKVQSNSYGLLSLARGEIYILQEEKTPAIIEDKGRFAFIADVSYPFAMLALHKYEKFIVKQS